MDIEREREKVARLARAVFGETENEVRRKLKVALESFSPEGLEPGREISVSSPNGTLILVYAPPETEA